MNMVNVAFKFVGVDPQDTAMFRCDGNTKQSVKMVVDEKPGFPCRVSLKEAEIGEAVWLTNYKHLNIDSPYAASHAVFVSEGKEIAELEPGEVPEIIEHYLVSVRAFDREGFMVDADVAKGREDVRGVLDRFFTERLVNEVHVHTARRGCFLARAIRC
ncbi:DUF1203 domain-containing protein [Vibrio coralliilyticus]|uniref:DUF1203 domain-containing protein n=1 Tax=Vibrio coralliilyticus TaxID=190893 RepID=UPI000C16A74A|nr:DUF1203 domain-containing protein [Vibrio coralliilyticus]